MKAFPTNKRDTEFYKTKREHVGEAQPAEPDGSCAHPFLVPSLDGTECVLAGRIDIGRHFLTRGGVDAIREPFDVMVSRLLSFGSYNFNLTKYPVMEKLFSDGKFTALATKVCPDERQTLDPFQFNFIIQVPGQTVALHVDGVYFWGATRFQFPQWLLAAMQFSGLFEDKFIDQVQVVGYIHDWEPTADRAGRFVYWDEDATPKEVPPTPLAGSGVDGSKTVHAARIYYPSRRPPIIDKSKRTSLVYRGGERWDVESGGQTLAQYTTDDLRISVVYRARCFADDAEAQRFYAHLNDEEEHMDLDEVLGIFARDLVSRGAVSTAEQAMEMPRLELALLILKTYIRYPIDTKSWIPLNYCMLGKLYPWMAPALSLLCA